MQLVSEKALQSMHDRECEVQKLRAISKFECHWCGCDLQDYYFYICTVHGNLFCETCMTTTQNDKQINEHRKDMAKCLNIPKRNCIWEKKRLDAHT